MSQGFAVVIEGLVKSYGAPWKRRRVLSGLDLKVPIGSIFGLLGPNGAGKTTTLRCLLGLTRPSKGSCRLLGFDALADLALVMGRVGSLVEGPGFFPSFSGQENLSLLARILGLPASSVDAAIERVGLTDAADRNYGKYSLGMKQRLGIAAALLKSPELLILDEPANGLDPAGILDVRNLLRSFRSEGRTVLLSSHLLGEVEELCDHVAVISRGTVVGAGPLAEILKGRAKRATLVRTSDDSRAAQALASAQISAVQTAEGLRIDGIVQLDSLSVILASDGISLLEFHTTGTESLENLFYELTEGGDRL